MTYQAMSVNDWSAMAENEPMVTAFAMEAALRGDKPSLLNLLQALTARTPGNRTFNTKDAGQATLDLDYGSPVGIASLTLEASDAQLATIMALAFEAPSPHETPLLNEQKRLDWNGAVLSRANATPHLPADRSHWSDLDEALLRAAIEAWRPGGVLAPQDGSETALARLAALVGRYAHHVEAVGAFERAGIDPDLFNRWAGTYNDCYDITPYDHQQPDVGRLSYRAPLTELMVGQGNLPAANALMDRLDTAPMRHAARNLIRSATNLQRNSGLPSTLVRMFPEKDEHTRSHLMALLVNLERLQPGLEARAMQLAALECALKVEREKRGRMDPDLVAALLALKGHADGKTLAQCLAHWDDMALRKRHGGDEAPVWAGTLVADLLRLATQIHCHQVLRAAHPILQDTGRDGHGLHGHLRAEQLLSCVFDLGVAQDFNKDAFRKTLEVFQDSSLALNAIFEVCGEKQKMGVLHRVAKSRHPATLDALAVALEVGMDPELPSSARRRPVTMIQDPERKARWQALVASHKARSSAHEVLQGLLEP